MLHPTEDFIMKHRYFATEYIAEYKGDAGPLRSTPTISARGSEPGARSSPTDL